MPEQAEPTPLERLVSRRDRLTSLLAECDDGSKAAALSRELRALDAEIEKSGGAKVGSDLDDLAARRAARLAEAESPDPPPVRKRSGRPRSD